MLMQQRCREPLRGSCPPPAAPHLVLRPWHRGAAVSHGTSPSRRGGAGLGRTFPPPLPSFPSPFPVCAAGRGNISAFSCFSAPGRLGPGSSPSAALPDSAAATCPGGRAPAPAASHHSVPGCRDNGQGGLAASLSHPGVFSPQRAQGGWIHLWCKAGVGRGAGWSGSGHGGVEATWKTHGGAVPGLFLAGNSRFPWHREGPQAGDGATLVVTPPRCPLHLLITGDGLRWWGCGWDGVHLEPPAFWQSPVRRSRWRGASSSQGRDLP